MALNATSPSFENGWRHRNPLQHYSIVNCGLCDPFLLLCVSIKPQFSLIFLVGLIGLLLHCVTMGLAEVMWPFQCPVTASLYAKIYRTCAELLATSSKSNEPKVQTLDKAPSACILKAPYMQYQGF